MKVYQITEKAVSKKQQQFFGIVRSMQKGDMPKSGEAGKVANDMKKSDVKDFAKTKHKGLPNKKTSENFADGKKKGKSRPGRVKRAGASCNGSVTSLRKRAKAASGEKARMYHWCANMKSGRKKKS